MKSPVLLGLICAMAVAVAGQENKGLPKVPSMELPPELKQVELSLAFRSGIAAQVAEGRLSTAEAVLQLRRKGTASGLPLDADTDLALAAIDIGRRLIVLGKPAAADEVFRQAETTLVQVVKAMPDSRAPDKAMRLQHLALVRADYLNKSAQAEKDLRQAVALDPENKHLQSALAKLAHKQPAQLKARLNQ